MKCKALLPALVVLPLLGGCATYHSTAAGKLDPEDFGEANRQTFAAMIVNPDPEYDTEMTGNAEQGTDAVERVREGTVKRPVRVSTTEGPDG
ncbi:MAG: hypothetical protein QNJ15_03145 [Erythrobacter sp.]|nr:hypothetical protein [Erythrobacter sp.]